MNIYAEKGTKLVYTGEGGYPMHKKHADKHLKIGQTYTLELAVVHDWHTDVFLREMPTVAFNSVHFEEL